MTVTLKDVGSGFKRTAINENFTTIESTLNSDVYLLDGSKQLEADLDFNSNKAINVAAGTLNADGVNLSQLNGAVSGIGAGTVSKLIEIQAGSAAVANVFTLAAITYTVGNNGLEVYRNGVEQELAVDYTETSTTEVTFIPTINATDSFKFKVYSAA